MKYQFKNREVAVYVYRTLINRYRARGEDITTIKLTNKRRTVSVDSNERIKLLEKLVSDMGVKITRIDS
jgi:hypothetical protein